MFVYPVSFLSSDLFLRLQIPNLSTKKCSLFSEVIHLVVKAISFLQQQILFRKKAFQC